MPKKIGPEHMQILVAFLRAKQAEKTEQVAKAGRPLRDIATPDLQERWVALFRQLVKQPGEPFLRATSDAIEGELFLRGQDLPLWEVSNELEAFDARLRTISSSLTDERKAELDEELADDMARLLGWDEPQH